MGIDKIEGKVLDLLDLIATGTKEDIARKIKSSKELFLVENNEIGIVLYAHVNLNTLPKLLKKNQEHYDEDILILKKLLKPLSEYSDTYWKYRDHDSMALILHHILDLLLFIRLQLCFYEHLPIDQVELLDKLNKFDLIQTGKLFKDFRDQNLITFYNLSLQGYNALIKGNKIETQNFLDQLASSIRVSPDKVLFHSLVCWDFASFCGDKEKESFYDARYNKDPLGTESNSKELPYSIELTQRPPKGKKHQNRIVLKYKNKENLELNEIRGEEFYFLYFLCLERLEGANVRWMPRMGESKATHIKNIKKYTGYKTMDYKWMKDDPVQKSKIVSDINKYLDSVIVYDSGNFTLIRGIINKGSISLIN